jgi:heme oxygenase
MTSPSAAACTLPDIVHALRDATRDAHARLDAHTPVLAPDLQLSVYHSILGRYLVAHGAVESALEPWAASLSLMGVVLEERRKVPLLARDRACTASILGTSAHDAGARVSFAVPRLASAWGALYVVEGSTLGGQQILKTLLNSELVLRNGLTPDAGLAYFTGYGSATSAMWRQMLRALGDADTADPGSRDAIIEGANSTFALFERALSLSPYRPTASV